MALLLFTAALWAAVVCSLEVIFRVTALFARVVALVAILTMMFLIWTGVVKP